AEETFDLVARAWSQVRSLLSEVKLTYNSATKTETRLINVDENHLEKAKLVGCGGMFAPPGNKAVMAQHKVSESPRMVFPKKIFFKNP
ncbi:hypothetical protein BGX26_003825, partial [Mortierella sp. AD094]